MQLYLTQNQTRKTMFNIHIRIISVNQLHRSGRDRSAMQKLDCGGEVGGELPAARWSASDQLGPCGTNYLQHTNANTPKPLWLKNKTPHIHNMPARHYQRRWPTATHRH
jgi:hypothetical protein